MVISDKTKVPLFAVLAAMPVIFGFIFWLTTIYAATIEAKEANIHQDLKIDQTRDILLDIRDRLIRIEERVNRKR
jgi:hypothetical protein